jgi:hypothetical protein
MFFDEKGFHEFTPNASLQARRERKQRALRTKTTEADPARERQDKASQAAGETRMYIPGVGNYL